MLAIFVNQCKIKHKDSVFFTYLYRRATPMPNKNTKPITPANNAANMQNANKGTSGTNRQYDQNQGNRGKQLNLNRKK